MSGPSYVRVAGYYVRVEPPVTLPRYDVWHLLGAGFAGFMAGVLALATLALHARP